VVELTHAQAAPLLRDLMASTGFLVRSVIGSNLHTDPTAGLDAGETAARRHPVFILTPVAVHERGMRP
jgi:hypothetical protein